MSPRRKTEEDETPIEGAADPAPKPKKKRAAPRKKKATTRKKPAAKKAEGVVAAPAPAAPKKSEGVSIPIKPAEQVNPLAPTPPPAPAAPNIKIQPEIYLGEAEDQDLWKPPRNGDADLSTPPKVLLQDKKAPRPEVMDILAEPEEEHEIEREPIRPVVRTGLFRKIALGFAFLAIIVGLGVMYVLYAHATVIVHPQESAIKADQDISVAADAGNGDTTGVIAEITVAGERTEAPSVATSTDAVATGTVTLHNKTSQDQILIPTTRLLAPDGTLFRLKSRVLIPAGGTKDAAAYADVAGATGDLGPTTFTIPGLNANLQKSIYAVSTEAMTGGVVSSGILTQADIDRTEQDLRDDLVGQAKQELAKKIDGKWTGQAFAVDTMNRFVSTAPGESTDGVTVRLTLRVREVAFDRAKAIAVAMDDLKRGLTADHELVGVDADHAAFSVIEANPKDGTATLHLTLKGQSSVTLGNPLFDAGALRGKGLSAVETYFQGIEGVQSVDVLFRPSWIKRMPDLTDHIEFKIQK